MSELQDIVIARKVYFSSAVDSEKSSYGTGYNYILETYIKGPPDPVSGLVINLIDLDKILKTVVGPLDHKHLNKDIPELKDKKITSALLAEYCFNEVNKHMGDLKKINPKVSLVMARVYQGDDQWGDYGQTL